MNNKLLYTLLILLSYMSILMVALNIVNSYWDVNTTFLAIIAVLSVWSMYIVGVAE